jgi:hypothetical protein
MRCRLSATVKLSNYHHCLISCAGDFVFMDFLASAELFCFVFAGHLQTR